MLQLIYNFNLRLQSQKKQLSIQRFQQMQAPKIKSLCFSLYFMIRKKKPDPFIINQQRKQHFEEKYQHTYGLPLDRHQDLMFCQTLYGRDCFVVGLTQNSKDSSIFIKSAIQNMNPKHVLLGNFNSSSVKTFHPFSESKKIVSQLTLQYETKFYPEELFCRQILTPLILEQINYNKNWFITPEKQNEVILIADHLNRRIITQDYLTVVSHVIRKQFTKLSFGVPSDLIIFEDLMLNCQIDKLRTVFSSIITRMKNNSRNKHLFHISSGLLVDEIHYQAEFQNELYEKQITFLTAMLNTMCSISQKPMLFVSKSFAPTIAENVHKITISPKSIYRNYMNDSQSQSGKKLSYYLSKDNCEAKIDQLLQKFVILNITKNNSLEIDLIVYKDNIFRKTIFSPIFQKIPIEQIIQRYRSIKKLFIQKILSIQFERLENIRTKYQEPGKTLLTLPQQIKTQRQRFIDFPYHFQPMNLEIARRSAEIQKAISQKVAEIVEYEKLQDEKELYQDHMKGIITKESIIFMTQILGDAKIRLGIEDKDMRNKMKSTPSLKFPVYHFEAFREIYKQKLSDQITGKNLRAREMIKQINKKIKQSNAQNKGKIIEINDRQQIQKYISGKIGADMPRIQMQMGEDGSFKSLRNQSSAQNIEQMLKDLGKDPFFSQIKQSIEADILKEKQAPQNQQKEENLYKPKKQKKS